MADIGISTFRAVPPFARGLMRDIRVRWALGEIGQGYTMQALDFEDRNAPDYRRRQPFGQVPTFEQGGASMFESGAILFRIARADDRLMPADDAGRDDVLMWMFAALNTVEPPVVALTGIDFTQSEAEWAPGARAHFLTQVETRLTALDVWLDGRDYLTGRFSIADILMATALRLMQHTSIVNGFADVRAYLDRCEARPAFQAALAAQLADLDAQQAIAA